MSVMFYTDRVKKSILIILLVFISCSALTAYANDSIKADQHSVNTQTTQDEKLFNFNNDRIKSYLAGDDPERFRNTTADDYVPNEIDLKRRISVPSDPRLMLFHFARRTAAENWEGYTPIPIKEKSIQEFDEFNLRLFDRGTKNLGPYITEKEMDQIYVELKTLLTKCNDLIGDRSGYSLIDFNPQSMTGNVPAKEILLGFSNLLPLAVKCQGFIFFSDNNSYLSSEFDKNILKKFNFHDFNYSAYNLTALKHYPNVSEFSREQKKEDAHYVDNVGLIKQDKGLQDKLFLNQLEIDKLYETVYLKIRASKLLPKFPFVTIPFSFIREHADETGLTQFIQDQEKIAGKQLHHDELAAIYFGTREKWQISLIDFLNKKSNQLGLKELSYDKFI